MAKRGKKFKGATRVFNIQLDDIQYRTFNLFKTLRPDLKSNQEVMEYAYNLFWKKYDSMPHFAYKLLDVPCNEYTNTIHFRHDLKENKLLDSKIEMINKKFKCNINKSEYFRRILSYLYYEYELFDISLEQPFLQEITDDFKDYLSTLDPKYQREILSALESMDDSTLDKENADDITLDIENRDDTTVEYENVDDLLAELENDDYLSLILENSDDKQSEMEDIEDKDLLEIQEDYDDYTLDYENN